MIAVLIAVVEAEHMVVKVGVANPSGGPSDILQKKQIYKGFCENLCFFFYIIYGYLYSEYKIAI